VKLYNKEIGISIEKFEKVVLIALRILF